jgi:hypothetical protein
MYAQHTWHPFLWSQPYDSILNVVRMEISHGEEGNITPRDGPSFILVEIDHLDSITLKEDSDANSVRLNVKDIVCVLNLDTEEGAGTNVKDGARPDGVDNVIEVLVGVIEVLLLARSEIVDHGYRVEFERFGNDVNAGTMHGNSDGIDFHGRDMDGRLVRLTPPGGAQVIDGNSLVVVDGKIGLFTITIETNGVLPMVVLCPGHIWRPGLGVREDALIRSNNEVHSNIVDLLAKSRNAGLGDHVENVTCGGFWEWFPSMGYGVSVPDAGPDLDQATMGDDDICILDLERADVVVEVLAERLVDVIILVVNDVDTSIFVDESSLVPNSFVEEIGRLDRG